jgi:hypothetical protein
MPVMDVLKLDDGARDVLREVHERCMALGVDVFGGAVAALEAGAGLRQGLSAARTAVDETFAALAAELAAAGVSAKALELAGRYESLKAATTGDGVLVAAVSRVGGVSRRDAVAAGRAAAPAALAGLAKVVAGAVEQAAKVRLPESAAVMQDARHEPAVLEAMRPADVERISAAYAVHNSAVDLYERLRGVPLGWLPDGGNSADSGWFGWRFPGRRLVDASNPRRSAVPGPVGFAVAIARGAGPGLYSVAEIEEHRGEWVELVDAFEARKSRLQQARLEAGEAVAELEKKADLIGRELPDLREQARCGYKSEAQQAAGRLEGLLAKRAEVQRQLPAARERFEAADAALTAHHVP